MKGWIKLYRKMLKNPVVLKDGDHLAVWVYLLLNATHANMDVMFSGRRITLEPGQLITSRKSISEKIKVSESKVQRILKLFENEQQIKQHTTSKNRLITIIRWYEYQRDELPIEPQLSNERTTSKPQLNTNNNVKKDNNSKNANEEMEYDYEKFYH
jgi:DNA replication protein DnaD